MTEIEELLRTAQQEIIQLRRTNEVLGAKVETMELFASVFRTSPARDGRGMAIDTVWRIDRMLEQLSNEPKPVQHASDCAVHNEPADIAGPCDCGAART